jgi:predicted O-linked N-acetylglucosamine transferase (SPINDLY family)
MLARPRTTTLSPGPLQGLRKPETSVRGDSAAGSPTQPTSRKARTAAVNRARALLATGDLEAVSREVSRMAVRWPRDPAILTLQVRVLAALQRHQALVDLLMDLPRDRHDWESWSHLADALRQLGRPSEALAAYMEALALCPAGGTLHYRLGLCFCDLGMRAQAVECFRTALMLDLGHLEAGVRDMVVFYERQLGVWHRDRDDLDDVRRAIAAMAPGAAASLNAFAHATLLDDPKDLLLSARACARYHARGVRVFPSRAAQPTARLRVGYASNDFHDHATSLLMAQLLERHDRQRFEVVLYDYGRGHAGATRERVLAAADRWVDIFALGDRDAAKLIHDDAVDILVDLKGYTRGARPALFASRPATLQVCYLGFPGTSGADHFDYLIGDAWVTPLQAADDYTEKLAQLPGCYQCNDGTRPLPRRESRVLHGLPEQATVLCGFTQPYKISSEVFDVWCRLLRSVPGAVLWLLDDNPHATAALRREASDRDIGPERVIFAPKMLNRAHLDRLTCADLFLDTWPCNGHTTVSDALWAGLPVVTWSGRTFASRVAGSLLRTLGFAELVCADVAGYEAMALDLARDVQRRHRLRHEIEASRLTSPLFDGALKARQLESLYERMWERAMRGLPPAHLCAQG